jgi:uncharacterized membrane protein YsdA (DUF1294 family)
MDRAPSRSAAPIWLLVVALLAEVALLMFSRLDLAAVSLVHVGFFSVIAFIVFGWDKWRATRGAHRVSEATLLAMSVLGGALGGLAAMLVTRHKTRRALFWFVVCGSLFVHVTLVGWFFISR